MHSAFGWSSSASSCKLRSGVIPGPTGVRPAALAGDCSTLRRRWPGRAMQHEPLRSEQRNQQDEHRRDGEEDQLEGLPGHQQPATKSGT